MKSFFENKTWVTLLVFAALIGLVILVAGLENLEFQQPFATQLSGSSNPFTIPDLPPGMGTLIFRYLIPGLFLLMYILSLGPARPQRGGSLVAALFRAVGFIVLFSLFFTQLVKKGGLFSAQALSGLTLPGAGDPLQDYSPPELTSSWSFWITTVLFVIFGAVVVFVVNRIFDRWFKPRTEMNELAEIAREALDDLSKKPSRNAIIRCYTNMNQTVSEKRGLVREAAVTPAEFALKLEGLGLPVDAVHGLTEIFERVRYGGQEAGAEEIKEAKRCLTSILKACETKR